MKNCFIKINEENKNTLNKSHEASHVYYSELNEWFTNNAFRSFSLKYVLAGTINYSAGKSVVEVKEGTFLIADKRDSGKAYFESAPLTKSICIDINSEVIAEAATVMAAKDNFDFDNYLTKYFTDSVICEYNCRCLRWYFRVITFYRKSYSFPGDFIRTVNS